MSPLYSLFLSHPCVATDTRDLPPSSIYFALRGARFDGNAFALEALEKGCAYAVVDDPAVQGSDRLIHVPCALTALQDLATEHRRALGLPILQITGTNGKTTTKELTAAVLARRYRVHYTSGNLNNHIGVPRTLLQLTREHELAVIETGANHPGEIAALSRIVDADCGLITNVGEAHLEGFGSLEGVLNTKCELYDYLRKKPRAFIFLHADNALLAPRAKGLEAVTYGSPASGATVQGEVTACTPYLQLRLRINGGTWREVSTHLIGAYNLDNALAAAAVGHHFGVSDDNIAAALTNYTPSNNRSELRRTPRGNTLIVDAYNANPTSMRAALDNFARTPHPHKLAILGMMAELGSASPAAHQAAVQQAEEAGCEALWLVGEAFRPFAAGHQYFATEEDVAAHIAAHPISDHLILIKGSNSTHLYRLPEKL